MLENRTLDRTIPVPLYYQLQTLIYEEISKGEYPPGSGIPVEKELCQLFDISRTTATQAVSNLVKKGYLYRVKNKGIFVSRLDASGIFYQTVISFREETYREKKVSTTEVMKLQIVALPERIATLTHEKSGNKAIHLARKRLVDGVPLARVETYMPFAACKFLLHRDFTEDSLYHVLSEQSKTKIARVTRYCEACIADEEDMAVLGVESNTPIQMFHTFGYNEAGTLIDFSISRYRGNLSKFKIEVLQDQSPR